MKKSTILLAALVAVLMVASAAAQMKQPKMESLSGQLIDLTCASKGEAMMGKWMNTAADHMMPDGKTQKDCAAMCLKGGQPAALFANNKVSAIFACNPRATLADFAAQNVEVQGFWAGAGATFIPTKIRKSGGSWADVNCETMHN